MSSCRSTGRRMMPRFVSLTYKFKSLPFKSAGSSSSLIGKSRRHRPARFSWTRRQSSSKRNMTKDIFFSPSGRKSPKPLPKETKISTGLVKSSQVWWINWIRISKLWTKERGNLTLKKGSIEKMRLRMS